MRFMVLVKSDKNTEAGVFPAEAEIETRQVFGATDFGPALTPDFREAEERLRAQAAGKR